MAGLESDDKSRVDKSRVFPGGIRRKLYFELRRILLCSVSLGARGRNIQKREYSHFRTVNDLLEVFEVIGPCGSAVAACSDPRRQAKMIGNDRRS